MPLGLSGSACGFPSLSIYVTKRGAFTLPPVFTSVKAGPLPSTFHAPSHWLAAVAPPHKNPFGKLILLTFTFYTYISTTNTCSSLIQWKPLQCFINKRIPEYPVMTSRACLVFMFYSFF